MNEFSEQLLEEKEDILANFPELKIDITDEELTKLVKRWTTDAQEVAKKVEDLAKDNVAMWKGDYQSSESLTGEEKRSRDNRIFSGLETFLPILTRQNPDPIVEKGTPEQMAAVRDELARITDEQKLKLKIKKSARYWSFYHLGILKISWNSENKEIEIKPKTAKKLMFDKHGYVEEGVYHGRFLGETCSMVAKDFVEKYPDSKEDVEKETKGNLDSFIEYIEWWAPNMFFVQYKKGFFGKSKNPYFNYDSKQDEPDEFGESVMVDIKAKNHFKKPQYPYSFLHVYESKESIFDETGLIQQAKVNQEQVDKRVRQINKNVSNMNNSNVFYGLDEQKVTAALKALENGGGVSLDDKSTQGFERVGGTPLSGDVYQDLNIHRATIDSIFATNAVTRGEETRDTTVRGKIISRQSDESRIGFIAEYVEQQVDYVFNWCVQLMYVFYDQTAEKPFLKESLPEKPMLVSVKDGSMIPKDPLTTRNEAMDLYNAGALDLLSLYEKLNVENPKEVATRTMIFKADPMMYLTEVLDFQPQQPVAPEQSQLQQEPLVPQVPPELPIIQ